MLRSFTTVMQSIIVNNYMNKMIRLSWYEGHNNKISFIWRCVEVEN